MLADYEAGHKTGMDIAAISDKIYDFTSGYPFLVSRICQRMDEKSDWSLDGVWEAVQVVLVEHSLLFDDLFKNLEIYPDLYELMYSVLIVGEEIPFNNDNPFIRLAHMFGYIKTGNNGFNRIIVANKIFEMRIGNYFISKDETSRKIKRQTSCVLYRDVIQDGVFVMELCLRKFAEYYAEIYTENDAPFLEKHGRLLFLSYLRPLINGVGFYHIESQFTNLKRMDIVVDFGRDQYIVELKRWKGEAGKEKAYEQLLGYMEMKNADKGYLLTFDFRKNANKEPKAEWVEVDGKRIFDVVV
jgi:hypothetical protein